MSRVLEGFRAAQYSTDIMDRMIAATPQNVINPLNVYTPTQQDQSDGEHNYVWNRHPDRAFYGHLNLSGSIALPATTLTRIVFGTLEVTTFNANNTPGVLDRIYIIDNGVYLLQFQCTFTAAETVNISVIGDSTAGNVPFYQTGNIATNASNMINIDILYRYWPYVGTDGQFSLGIGVTPTTAATLTTADFQLACVGRLPFPLVSNP